MEIEECVAQADQYVEEQDRFLLLFDVNGANDERKYPDRAALQRELKSFVAEVTEAFAEYLPEHRLVVDTVGEQGFKISHGDGGYAAVNDAHVVPDIIQYQTEEYPGLDLEWAVARDDWDPVFDDVLK